MADTPPDTLYRDSRPRRPCGVFASSQEQQDDGLPLRLIDGKPRDGYVFHVPDEYTARFYHWTNETMRFGEPGSADGHRPKDRFC